MYARNKTAISLFKFVAKPKLRYQLNFRECDFFCTSVNASNKLEQSPDLEVKPFKENGTDVWIGPPNLASNLRLKVFPISTDLSVEERHFYAKSKEVQDWNQEYWAAHNKDFSESRKLYIDKVLKENNMSKEESLSPEEMTVFYKDFLDRNRTKHIAYNWNWYRRNINLIFLAAMTKLTKYSKLIKNTVKLKS